MFFRGYIYINLKFLKATNDKYGHDYGDSLLHKLRNVSISIFLYKSYQIG